MQFYHFMDTKWLLFIWQNFMQSIYFKSWYCWSKTDTPTDVDCLVSFLVSFCVAKFFNAFILAPQKRDVKEITQRADSRVQEKRFFNNVKLISLAWKMVEILLPVNWQKSNNNSTISTVGFFPLFNLLKSKQKYSKYLLNNSFSFITWLKLSIVNKGWRQIQDAEET